MNPYAPRPILFDGIHIHAGWQLKRYRIRYGDGAFEASRFAAGVLQASADLPLPAVTEVRAGVGFLIEHQGRGMDYLVLGWWDRENELPLRIWVCERGDADCWRRAAGAESLCVWDLQVVWHEREAYVKTVLSGNAGSGSDDYLALALQTAG